MRRSLRLDVRSIHIEDVRLGNATSVSGHTLTISNREVASTVLSDARIADVEIAIARAGEDVRIVHCLDAVEPRTKPGVGTVFPGFLGGMDTVGEGRTVRIDGVSVLASSRYPQPLSGLLQAREAVVDMSGPTAVYSPMSRVCNVVLVYTPNPTVGNDDYDDTIRRATLRVAEMVARRALPTADAVADSTTTFDFSTPHPDLPNVVYFYQLQGQGSMADTYLYGRTIHNLVPTLIHPNEVIDGAIVSGVHVYACYKNPTFLHQNNPIIWELQERHGRDLNFAGVIINRGHNYTQEDKERSSHWAAKLAGFLEADGAVLTAEGGSKSAIDMMLACRYMEQAGIRTVVVSSEAGRRRVRLPALLHSARGRRHRQRRLRGRDRDHAGGRAGDRGRPAARRRNAGPRPGRPQDVLPLLRRQPAGRQHTHREGFLVVCLQNNLACSGSHRRPSLRSASSTYAAGMPSSAGLARNAAAGAYHAAISQTDR